MGFQHLSAEERSRISRLGGKASTGGRFDSESGARAGKKGGPKSPTQFGKGAHKGGRPRKKSA
jgi:general stress protein YciG